MDKIYRKIKNSSSGSMELIKEIMDDVGENMLLEFMIKENIHNPWDISFRFITGKYPKEAHETYGFPGKFLKPLNTTVITEDGTALEMDYAAMILLEEDIHEKSALNVEHQSTLPTQDKIDTIYKYNLHLVMTHRLPALSAIISPHKIEKEIYKSGHNIFGILPIDAGDEEIYERLNNLKNKINNNRKLTLSEALNFTFIATFVSKEKGKEILDILARLFTQAELDSEWQLDIFFVLKTMIKTHFKDDEKKLRELLKMIIETIPKPDYRNMSLYERYIMELEKTVDDYKTEIDDYKTEIDDYKTEIKKLTKQLELKNNSG